MHAFSQVATELAPMARQRLASYVRHESPTGDREALDQLADVLTRRYRELGGHVSREASETGAHLVATFNGSAASGSEHILVLGHHDTVWPRGHLDGPMPYVEADDRIAGPGVFDMKGGLVVFETALEILAHTNTPARPVRLVVAADEEVGSPTARSLVEEHLRGAVAALGLEPPHADGGLKTARYGSTRVRLRVTGVESHAALDVRRGVSAIDELVDQLLAIRALTADETGVLCNVGTVEGGGRTNVTAGDAYADIGLRFADTASENRVLTALAALEPVRSGATVEPRILTNRPAWPAGGSEGLLAAVAAAGELVGQQVRGKPARGAADTNIAGAAGVPALDGFGPVGQGAHALHEHIVPASLTERAALLAAVLSQL